MSNFPSDGNQSELYAGTSYAKKFFLHSTGHYHHSKTSLRLSKAVEHPASPWKQALQASTLFVSLNSTTSRFHFEEVKACYDHKLLVGYWCNVHDTISESGFGHGSSLIICAGILTGYTETLFKMLSHFKGNTVSFWSYLVAVIGIFTVVTMWAVLITEGCRKIKLKYYAFKLASASRSGGSPVTEVEPYIPFNINPSGMQPVLTTTYLLAFPSIIASIFNSPFWENLKEILNPGSSIGAEPWVFYAIYAVFVFLFNIFDIANLPKEISDYMTKMGARIPNIKPGKATVEYLTKIQASTRFWGGVLLSMLATSSSILDHNLRRMNENFSIGFTSVLIIVLRRYGV